MRHAMAPRLAIRTLSNIPDPRTRAGPSRLELATGGSSRGPTGCSARRPDQNLYRRGIVGVAGIVELGAVGDQYHHVHLGPHLYVAPWTGDSVGELEPAVARHRHVHEEIDVARQVPLAQVLVVARER